MSFSGDVDVFVGVCRTVSNLDIIVELRFMKQALHSSWCVLRSFTFLFVLFLHISHTFSGVYPVIISLDLFFYEIVSCNCRWLMGDNRE